MRPHCISLDTTSIDMMFEMGWVTVDCYRSPYELSRKHLGCAIQTGIRQKKAMTPFIMGCGGVGKPENISVDTTHHHLNKVIRAC